MDNLYKGILYSMNKEAWAPVASAVGKTIGTLGRGAIGLIKKSPGTAISAAFAAPAAVGVASKMKGAYGLSHQLPKIRTDLNKAFPQGQPGKMLGGF